MQSCRWAALLLLVSAGCAPPEATPEDYCAAAIEAGCIGDRSDAYETCIDLVRQREASAYEADCGPQYQEVLECMIVDAETGVCSAWGSSRFCQAERDRQRYCFTREWDELVPPGPGT